MCKAEALTERKVEDACDFLECCRKLAATNPGEENFWTTQFAPALLDWVRHPLLQECTHIQVKAPCYVSTGSDSFRAIHRSLHTLLERYVEQQIMRYDPSPKPRAFDARDWRALVREVEGAADPSSFRKLVQDLWCALAMPAKHYFNDGLDLNRISRFILPPSLFRLVLVVDMCVSNDIPALFAIELPDSTLQPICDWLQTHWQETEKIHALSEQWKAMVDRCFNAYWAEIDFCNAFVVSKELARHLRSGVCSEQLAWFNCTLLERIPQRVKPQDITVRGKLGERSLSGEFNAEALLDFSYEVMINGQVLSDEDLLRLMKAEQGKDLTFGEYILPANLVTTLSAQLQALQGLDSGQTGRGLTLFEGLRLIAGLSVRNFDNNGEIPKAFQVSAQLARFLAGGETQTIPDLPEETAAQLRPYQLAGVRFLWEGTERGLGVFLADDMGLGKTLQVLALLQLWKRAGVMAKAPVLIIVPPTLLENWRTEQQRWAPELSLKICHPKWMDAEAWKRLEANPGEVLRGVDIALFSYQMILRVSALQQVTFPAIILDEAQAIKNPDSQQSQAVRKLCAERRIVLTGTPVENSLLDLWTLFDFLNPGLLGPQEQIRRMNLHPEDFMPALRQLVKPFLLRRQKGDPGILEELPEKYEQLVPCVLTPAQALAYRQLVETLREGLKKTTVRFSRGGLVLRTLVRLKQICNHPAQLTHALDYPPEQSGKFLKLLELAGEIVATGEKFLLFTQFYAIIAPLHTLLAERLGCPGFVLHGSTSVEERKARVEAFQRHVGPAFFILSLRAGGVGLNLTAATHVIHFDRWWNPAVENQASDRAYRIGQQHRVTIHKFICHGTLEERIDDLLEQKRALSENLLCAGPEKLLTAMSNEELLNLVCLSTIEEP